MVQFLYQTDSSLKNYNYLEKIMISFYKGLRSPLLHLSGVTFFNQKVGLLTCPTVEQKGWGVAGTAFRLPGRLALVE